MSRTGSCLKNAVRRRVLLAAGSVSIVLALLIALTVLYARPLIAGPALTQLVITGKLEHVSPQVVRAVVRPVLGSGFFTSDMSAVRAAVDVLPWVQTASVRRGWPHTLYIEINEETPAARWNGTGLMDARGRVFTHSGGQSWVQLPQLSGPDGSAATVLTEYHTFGALLAPKGLAIRKLDVDARGAATLELSDGIRVRLGRQQAEVRLERFAAVALQVLASQITRVAYVDMRYTNGFAVGYMPTCQWPVGADSKRRAMEGAAGQSTMDGSQSCATACVAAGQPVVTASQAQCATGSEAKPND